MSCLLYTIKWHQARICQRSCQPKYKCWPFSKLLLYMLVSLLGTKQCLRSLRLLFISSIPAMWNNGITVGENKSCLLWTEDSCIFVCGHRGNCLTHLTCFKTFLTFVMLQKLSSWIRPGIVPQSTGSDCWQGTIKDLFWATDWFVGFGSSQSRNAKWFQGTVARDKRIDTCRFTSEIIFHVSFQA